MKYFLFILCLLFAGCGDQEDENTVYSCRWKDRKVCEEYLPQGTEIVDRTAAEQQCTRAPTSANEYGNGSFSATHCSQANTLGRCVITPSYQARRYYSVGFSGVMSSTDPLNDTIETACGWLASDAYYERPPYAD